jgi:dipeptidyl aminopeptidase/acylaminoacyl peptidase
VSKPFPYSILYYTDEFDDRGKALRKALAEFEKNYNAEVYSLTNYLDWIKAPIQLHQGVSDEEVPLAWSDEFKKILAEKEKQVEYYAYPGENHNFQNGSWQTAVERSLNFIKNNIK